MIIASSTAFCTHKPAKPIRDEMIGLHLPEASSASQNPTQSFAPIIATKLSRFSPPHYHVQAKVSGINHANPHCITTTINGGHDAVEAQGHLSSLFGNASYSPSYHSTERMEEMVHYESQQQPLSDASSQSGSSSLAYQTTASSQSTPLSNSVSEQGSDTESHGAFDPSRLFHPLSSPWLEVRARSLSLNEEVTPDGSRYDLRPMAQYDPCIFEVSYDADNSGNFDPRRPHANFKDHKYKRTKNNDGDDAIHTEEKLPKKQRRLNVLYARWDDEHCPIMIQLSKKTLDSPRGEALLSALSTAQDNWPSYVDDLFLPQENFAELSMAAIQPSRLRSREGAAAGPHIYKNFSTNLPTLGYPDARGCKACYEVGISCNLLNDAERWPCQHCVEEDEECELLLEPLEKRTCERCRKRRFRCSFRASEDHRGPCVQCIQKGFNCVAGPKSGRVRSGPSLTTEWMSLQISRESPTRYRILLSFNRFGPRGGHFVALVVDGQVTPHSIFSFNPLSFKYNETPIKGVEIARMARKGAMAFSSDSDSSCQFTECTWCKDSGLGILAPPDQKMANMCIDCASQRVDIINCPGHEMQPPSKAVLDAIDPETYDLWYDPPPGTKPPFKWCQACTNPATKICKTHVKGGSQECSGCGLHLCDPCVVLLELKGGSLTEMIKGAQKTPETTAKRLRWDAGFLRKDGSLYEDAMKNYAPCRD